jgi:hypothetical protein
VVALVLVAIASPAPAQASFTDATLLSGNAEQQFAEANEPAVSGSGEYVAFQGKLAEKLGVWRRDPSGEVQLVAREASSPSISEDGRFVVFTTNRDLEPLHEGPEGQLEGEPPEDDGCPEVYVRDMDVGEGEAGAYTLVSALEESPDHTKREGILFEAEGRGCEGSRVAPGVAMSADGAEVVFTVASQSNLAGKGTPPGQVAVRNLQKHTTTLITVTPEGKPVAGGGAFPNAYALGLGAPFASTAAISADGNAVAWYGTNVAEQVSATELGREPELGSTPMESEFEPLWRRVEGPIAGTRRLLTNAGLAFFAPNPLEEPSPVQSGAFIAKPAPYDAPSLSADGETVGVLANAPPRSALPSILEGKLGITEYDSDAYIVHVDDDPASPPRVTPLTEVATYTLERAEREEIDDIAVSPDGTRVAFDTSRFPLESPSFIPVSVPIGGSEIYEVNLEFGTLQRVTASYDGGGVNGSTGLISFGEAHTLAFASTATDLFYGDGVNASEVYETHELPTDEQPVEPTTSEAPGLPLPAAEWTLGATAAPQADGSVLVDVQAPGAGRLGVEARAQLPGGPTARTRGTVAKRARRSKRPTARQSRPSKRSTSSVAQLATRTVARAQAIAAGPVEVTVRARVSTQYQPLLMSKGGLYVVLRVTFSSPGHPALTREIPVTLRDIVPGSNRDGARRANACQRKASGKRVRRCPSAKR